MNSITKQELLSEVKRKLQKPPKLPGMAAELGYEVFLLSMRDPGSGDPEVRDLTEAFHAYVKKHECFQMVQDQIDYAIRLSSDKYDLLYEEMYKLFSLCDEIEGLRKLGYEADNESYACLGQALRERFRREKKKAHLVAEDRVKDWNRAWWWYAENL